MGLLEYADYALAGHVKIAAAFRITTEAALRSAKLWRDAAQYKECPLRKASVPPDGNG